MLGQDESGGMVSETDFISLCGRKKCMFVFLGLNRFGSRPIDCSLAEKWSFSIWDFAVDLEFYWGEKSD